MSSPFHHPPTVNDGFQLLGQFTSDTGSVPYAGAFFPSSQHLRIGGGVFTSNVTNNIQAVLTVPSNLRMIPVGDIDLRKEIRLDGESPVVMSRRRAQGCIRRLYTAKIEGRGPDMTVVQYQGDNAEDEWRRDISKVSCIRHPNFVQIYAAANSHGIHATIFHDDLVPLQHFLDLYCHSHFATVYIWAYCNTEFWDAINYFHLMFQTFLVEVDCTFFIRGSTGRLCVNLLPTYKHDPFQFLNPLEGLQISWPESRTIFDGANPETIIISSLTLLEYHQTCALNLRRCRYFLACPHAVVKAGAIFACSSSAQLDESAEIAFLPSPVHYVGSWSIDRGVLGKTLVNGWTRYSACDVSGLKLYSLTFFWYVHQWLSQANHVFSRLRITSNYDGYAFVDRVDFRLEILTTSRNPPDGYLFVCPQGDLQSQPGSFIWPDCPAYWSLDPAGVERLTAEKAGKLGFPAIELKTELYGHSWDASVYAGLRKFHQAKGFDPDSQDIALHLDERLYRLSSEVETPFAHVDDENISSNVTERNRLLIKDDRDNDKYENHRREGGKPARAPTLDDLGGINTRKITIDIVS
ncbi:hypothetical protein B0H13DRAFT_2494643 [Mycena leptocephala]|nr:hypothetical protein B0H13DRAFT_2494643 [Mycena leptocephala]